MTTSSPNILLIFTDQQRADTLKCYEPNTICQTPNLDRMAEESVVFQNAYTVCAVCSPARASLQTGVYPHTHGVTANTYSQGCNIHELPDSDALLSRRLQQADYSIGYTGKWHLGDGGYATILQHQDGRLPMAPIHCGLPSTLGYEGDDFPGHGGGGYAFKQYHNHLRDNDLFVELTDFKNYGGHTTTGEITSPIESTNEHFLANRAIENIDRFRKREKPFCFQLHFWGPHEPFFAPTQYLDLYRETPIPQWPNFDEDRTHKPKFHNVFRHPDKPWSFWEKALRYYYGFMTSIDAEIGRVIQYLKDNDLYDNTLIIFSADHGDSHGCHGGIENKSYHMYQETVRIPMMIKPAGDSPTPGDCTSLTNTCDLYATILDAAGVAIDEKDKIHGKSLLPFTDGETPEDWRDCVVSEGLSVTNVQCTHRMIRKGDWKYVFYAAGTDELYDLENDPWEIENRIDHPDCQAHLLDLKQALFRWLEESGDELLKDYGMIVPEARAEPENKPAAPATRDRDAFDGLLRVRS